MSERLQTAARNLLATWEESADYLDAKWLGMEERVVELHEALRGMPCEHEWKAPMGTAHYRCVKCGSKP